MEPGSGAREAPPPGAAYGQPDPVTLEVELSYSAFMLASASASAWFLYEYAKNPGFTTIGLLVLDLLLLTAIECFAIGLFLHLVLRGLWMAAGMPTPEGGLEDERARALRELDRRSRVLFHDVWWFLIAGLALIGFLTGLYFCLAAWTSLTVIAGVGILAPYVLAVAYAAPMFLPGARFRGAYRERVETTFRSAFRDLGLIWAVSTDLPRARRRRLAWALATLGALGLYGRNLRMVATPEFSSEKDVYSRGADRAVVLHFRQGGVQGQADSERHFSVDAPGLPPVVFESLALHRYVAVLPLARIPPGRYRVRAKLDLRQRSAVTGGKASIPLVGSPGEVSFLVTE